mgnify:CR=1 FL=1
MFRKREHRGNPPGPDTTQYLLDAVGTLNQSVLELTDLVGELNRSNDLAHRRIERIQRAIAHHPQT